MTKRIYYLTLKITKEKVPGLNNLKLVRLIFYLPNHYPFDFWDRRVLVGKKSYLLFRGWSKVESFSYPTPEDYGLGVSAPTSILGSIRHLC